MPPRQSQVKGSLSESLTYNLFIFIVIKISSSCTHGTSLVFNTCSIAISTDIYNTCSIAISTIVFNAIYFYQTSSFTIFTGIFNTISFIKTSSFTTAAFIFDETHTATIIAVTHNSSFMIFYHIFCNYCAKTKRIPTQSLRRHSPSHYLIMCPRKK